MKLFIDMTITSKGQDILLYHPRLIHPQKRKNIYSYVYKSHIVVDRSRQRVRYSFEQTRSGTSKLRCAPELFSATVNICRSVCLCVCTSEGKEDSLVPGYRRQVDPQVLQELLQVVQGFASQAGRSRRPCSHQGKVTLGQTLFICQ